MSSAGTKTSMQERIDAAATAVDEGKYCDHVSFGLCPDCIRKILHDVATAEVYRDKFPDCIDNAHCQSRREHGDGGCGCFHDSLGMLAAGTTPKPQPQRLWTKGQMLAEVEAAVRAERERMQRVMADMMRSRTERDIELERIERSTK